jgi:hypothetical protein
LDNLTLPTAASAVAGQIMEINMQKENQNKLPNVFGDLVSINAYSDLTGISQEVLKEQASSHNAAIIIGLTCYIRLSTLLMNQLSELKIPDGTANEAIDSSHIVSSEHTISEHHCLINHLSALSSIKQNKLKNLYIQMLKEKDPHKRIEIASEYNLVYFNIDKISKELEFTKKRLREVGEKQRKVYDSIYENAKAESNSGKEFFEKIDEQFERDSDTLFSGQTKWITIGRVFIDTATILLCDPIRFLEDVDFMRELAAMGNEQFYRQVGDETGVLSRTGMGDGTYEVEALVGEDDGVVFQILELRIKFMDQDNLEE